MPLGSPSEWTSQLVRFLCSGRLPGIAPGMSREAVRRSVGEPHDTSAFGHPPTIWKYGPFELHFVAGRVSRIYADDLATHPVRAEVEVLLTQNAVGFQSEPNPYEPETELVVTAADAAVLFSAGGYALAVWAPARRVNESSF